MQSDISEVTLTGSGATALPNGPTAFLTYKEFAHQSRLSPSSVRKRVRQGELRVTRIGRSVRIPRSELDRLARQARVNAQ